MTRIIHKDPIFKIEEINTNSAFDRLKHQVNPATQCFCISSYTRSTRVVLLDADSEDDTGGLGLMIGVFESDPCAEDTYHIFEVSEPLCEKVIEFIHSTNIGVVTYDAKPLLIHMFRKGVSVPEAIWDLKIYERCVTLGKININYQIKEQGNFSSRFKEELQDSREKFLRIQSMCKFNKIECALGDSMSRCRYGAGLKLATWASIYFNQRMQAERRGMLTYMVDTEMPWVVTNAMFEYIGVRVDDDLRQNIVAAYNLHWPKIEAYLKSKGLSNIGSDKSVTACLKKHGLLPLFRKGTGYDVSKDALKSRINLHPLIREIYEYRKIQALINEKMLSPGLAGPDGRVHPTHVQLATETGRQASEEPNVLGLSKLVRTIIIPESGYGIGEVDLSQIEVGISAAFYNDEALIHAFNTGDVYSSMAQKFYGDQLTLEDKALSGADFKYKHPQKRQTLKICTLAILYGSGRTSLASNLGVSTQEAEALLNGFLSLYPVLRDGIRHGISAGLHNGYIQTITGLRIHLDPEVSQSGRERMCRNYPIQGSAAVAFKHAGNQLRRAYPAYRARLLIPLHDSYIFEAPLDLLEDVAQITSEIMCESVQHFFPKLTPRTEINITHPERWNKDGDVGVIERWIAKGKF